MVDMAAAEDSAGGDGSRLEAPAATTAAPGVDFSGTNTQEVGVDEGDIVETDGTYVYVAGQDGLRIVSVADAAVVASPELPGGAHQMILDGNRLLVATQGYTTAEDTVVSLFDVSDPTNPTLLRRSHLEGRLVASRAADGTVRLVLSASLAARLPFVHPDEFGLDEDRSPSATGRSSRSRRCRIGCRVGSTRPATGRSARWRSRSTAPTSPPPVTSRVSVSRGSPRSTSMARRHPRVRPASCRPARRCTHRRPTSTSPLSRGTGTGRSSRATRRPIRTRRRPP